MTNRHGKHRDPRHTFSFPEDEWEDLLDLAAARGEYLTDVIRRALRDYAERKDTPCTPS